MDNSHQKRKVFLVTGSAGFIGFHVAKRLLEAGHAVHGIDLMTASYYDPLLKDARLNVLQKLPGYTHHRIDLADTVVINEFKESIGNIDVIIHLAAQACVLRSFEFPHEYVQDNIVAFQNMLELYGRNETVLFMYASSSSVYGQSDEGSIITEEKSTDLPYLYMEQPKSPTRRWRSHTIPIIENRLLDFAFSRYMDLGPAQTLFSLNLLISCTRIGR